MQYGGEYSYSYSPWGGNLTSGNQYADILMGLGFDGYYEGAFPPTYKNKAEFRFAGFNFLNHDLLSFNPSDSNLHLNFNSDGTLKNATDTNDNCPGPFCQAFGYADYHYGHRILEWGAKYSF